MQQRMFSYSIAEAVNLVAFEKPAPAGSGPAPTSSINDAHRLPGCPDPQQRCADAPMAVPSLDASLGEPA